MKAVEKAIWYIERNYDQTIKLDDLANAANISRYYLSRTFIYTTGIPISRYLRDRRLSHAAIALAAGKKDILDLALSMGYGSHEAFSRAFKFKFGYTPESIRTQGHTENLNLMEAMAMTTKISSNLAEPRIINRNALLFAGLSKKYIDGSTSVIPNQWTAFSRRVGSISGQIGKDTFGVICNIDDEENLEYMCAVEVSSFNDLQDDVSRLRLPEQLYAVFHHDNHVSEIKATCVSIWRDWLPNSGREPADSPFFERYTETFNPETGNGGIEIWLPIESIE